MCVYGIRFVSDPYNNKSIKLSRKGNVPQYTCTRENAFNHNVIHASTCAKLYTAKKFKLSYTKCSTFPDYVREMGMNTNKNKANKN
jgi:hypothetical protein